MQQPAGPQCTSARCHRPPRAQHPYPATTVTSMNSNDAPGLCPKGSSPCPILNHSPPVSAHNAANTGR